MINRFSESGVVNKGVDIRGKSGQYVVAAAHGEVVYAGDGLRGHDYLIIVKHDNVYLSAYAHDSKTLIREGDRVNKGQAIAVFQGQKTSQTLRITYFILKLEKKELLSILSLFLKASDRLSRFMLLIRHGHEITLTFWRRTGAD